MTDPPRFQPVPITHPDALVLIEAVQGEYVVRYGSRDDTPLDPSMFDPPVGVFFLAYCGIDPVATGAWRRRGDLAAYDGVAIAEIKRMYVATTHRGQGLARAMLAHLEATARAAGIQVLVLETGTAQPEAIGLYESSGYEPITPFGHYRDSPLNRCFARVL